MPTMYLEEWRHVRGLKQRELAKKAGIRTATVSDLERRRQSPNEETIQSLKKALQITRSDLFRNPFWDVKVSAMEAEEA